MTESAYVIPKGHLQFETGFDYSKESENATSKSYNSSLFRFGLTNNTELRFGFEFVKETEDILDSEKNSTPLYFGSKIHLLEKKNKLAQIALIVVYVVNIQKVGIRTIVDFTPNVIFTFENDLTDNISIGYNLGIDYSSIAKEIMGIVSASVGVGLGEKSGFYLEGAYFPAPNTNDAQFNFGLTHQIIQAFQLDVYRGLGLLADSPVFNAVAGLIYLF
ncbi:MAG: hypothetical protein PF541_15860 [Prolixibacteraceae bacterium]|jgi:hypothetical protein|nr:hypothetical protein [Prolixibacteraceae bacterium]